MTKAQAMDKAQRIVDQIGEWSMNKEDVVAYIAKALEDASQENRKMYIDKDGIPQFIQERARLVLPDEKSVGKMSMRLEESERNKGFNLCLDELRRLNPWIGEP